MNRSSRRTAQRGQTLVIVAVAMVALIGAAGIVIDGGNAFAQERKAQNGADAAAEAGATQLARKMLGVPGTDDVWSQNVLNAVNATAMANGITAVDTPSWTDFDGVVLGPVQVGLPIPANTQGVQVRGNLEFDTYLAKVVGSPRWKASTTATAITGFAQQTGFGGVIPVTFPILLTQCTAGGGSGDLAFPLDGSGSGIPWPFGPNNLVAIPLCSNGPGNVGWIDWDPPAGGASDVADSITNPDNDPISTPHWYYITETGENSSLDPPMDTLEGKDILIPIFHAQVDDPLTTGFDESLLGTCDVEPGGDQDLITDCPTADIGANGQGWYFLVTFGVFHLEHSYIQQNHQLECNDTTTLISPASPIGASNPEQVNRCLIGYFKDAVVASNMTVGAGVPSGVNQFTPFAIQLIK